MSVPPAITLELDLHAGPYWPGDTISGRFGVAAQKAGDVRAIELSVLWYTVGQGEEDLAVQHFERHAVDETASEQTVNFSSLRHFQATLPNSPLSYEGVLVKIRWCARVRAFLAGGKEVVSEQGFFLGAVPCAQVVD